MDYALYNTLNARTEIYMFYYGMIHYLGGFEIGDIPRAGTNIPRSEIVSNRRSFDFLLAYLSVNSPFSDPVTRKLSCSV